MKKILFSSIFALLFMFMTMGSASAAQMKYYDADMPTRSTAYFPYITASSNYVYALNDILDSAGSAAIHSFVQTKYNGSNIATIGGKLTMTGNYDGAVLWRPNYVSTNPSGYTIYASGKCSGENTTGNLCAVQGSQYRLQLNNENFLFSYSIYGRFVITN